jgi:hypothetical protein
MEVQAFGRPTIPPKNGYYIARGRLTCGGMHKKPKFVADFYVEKSNENIGGYGFSSSNDPSPATTFKNLFDKSVKRFAKETDADFQDRCYKKWGQHYIYFHYKDADWTALLPAREVA